MASNERKMKMIMDLCDVISDTVTADDIIKALRSVEKQRERMRKKYIAKKTPRGRQQNEPMIYTGDL
jgi:hypothetical protein